MPAKNKNAKDRRAADRSADSYCFIKTEDFCLADLWPEIPSSEPLTETECPLANIPDEYIPPVVGRRLFPTQPKKQDMVSHSVLVQEISKEIGINASVVSTVLITMCQVICKYILNKKSIQFFGLGSLIPYELHQKRFKERNNEYVKIGFVRRLWVFFLPSLPLVKDMIQTFGIRNVLGWDWVVPRRKNSKKRLDFFPFINKVNPEELINDENNQPDS